VNLRVGYEHEKFDVVLWSENLFNHEYTVRSWAWMTPGVTYVQDGPPRRVGLNMTYRF